MKSSYKNHYGDTQWDFGCEEQPFKYDTQKCKWTGWLNDWYNDLLYTCNTVDGANYIAGMYSEQVNTKIGQQKLGDLSLNAVLGKGPVSQTVSSPTTSMTIMDGSALAKSLKIET